MAIANTNKALSVLLRTFGEAISGAREYADEFEALGINVQEFAAVRTGPVSVASSGSQTASGAWSPRPFGPGWRRPSSAGRASSC